MQGQKQTEVPEFKIIIKDVEASILILIAYKYRRRKKNKWKYGRCSALETRMH